MKRTALINSELSYVVAKLGHFDELTVCDAGLPIPPEVARIDLALSEGVPSFMQTVKAVLSEMEVQGVQLASEFPEVSPELHQELLDFIDSVADDRGKPIAVSYVSHEEYKANLKKSVAIVRTGEFTPYANVTFSAGVVF